MKNCKAAVIGFLSMYTFCLAHIDYNDEYILVIDKVSDYFSILEDFEVDILSRRYIKNNSLNKITLDLGYKSHSSVSSILDSTLDKLVTYELSNLFH